MIYRYALKHFLGHWREKIMQQWTKKNETERELDFARIGRVLLKRAWLIIVVALVFGSVAFIGSAVFITPTYRAYFTAYVNNRMTSETAHTSTGDLTASMGLVYVYQDIITSRSVLEQAAEECGTTYSKVKGSVTAYVSDTAPVVTVVVETTSPKLSLKLAEKVADLAPGKVAEVVDGSSMRIIDPPVASSGKASPNNLRNGLLGLLIGLVGAVVMCIVVDLIYDYVQDDSDIERRYSVPVIGHIPDIIQAEKSPNNYSYRKAGADRK